MTRLAFLQIGDARIVGVVGDLHKDKLSLDQHLVEPAAGIPAAPDSQKKLADLLARHGFTERKVYLVLPRKFAFVRYLPIPKGTPEEIRSMALFQMGKDLPVPLAKLYYSIRSCGERDGKNLVSFSAVPDDIVDARLDLLKRCGIKALGIVLESDCITSLVPASGEPTAILYPCDAAYKLAVAKDQSTIFSVSIIPSEGTNSETLAPQLQRVLASWSNSGPQMSLARIYTFEKLEGLQGLLGSNVVLEQLDLASHVENHPPGEKLSLELAPLIGVAKTALKDKLLAKTPLEKKTNRWKKPLALASIPILLLIGATIFLHVRAGAIEAEVAEKRNELKATSAKTQEVEKLRSTFDSARTWAAGRPRWLELLKGVWQYTNPQQLYFTEFNAEQEGSVQAHGRAVRKDSVTALVESLGQNGLFESISITSMTESANKSGFIVEFTFRGRLKDAENRP